MWVPGFEHGCINMGDVIIAIISCYIPSVVPFIDGEIQLHIIIYIIIIMYMIYIYMLNHIQYIHKFRSHENSPQAGADLGASPLQSRLDPRRRRICRGHGALGEKVMM